MKINETVKVRYFLGVWKGVVNVFAVGLVPTMEGFSLI